jgi:hypothetical protein
MRRSLFNRVRNEQASVYLFVYMERDFREARAIL